jgi:acyl-CoA thioesterase YciA
MVPVVALRKGRRQLHPVEKIVPDKVESRPLRQPAVRVVLLPRDTNKHGTIFGGIILSYIDIAGAVEAWRHTKDKIVTVAMNEVVFKAPVEVGEVVSFYAEMTRIGTTSISIHVEVEVERAGMTIPVTAADLTYVCIGEDGRPTPVKQPGA